MDQRNVSIYDINPVQAGLCGARTLIVVKRTSSSQVSEEPKNAFYISSHSCENKAKYFSNLVRGHWSGCESKNHWVRDACMSEDKTRCKNYRINCNLTTLRVCVLSMKYKYYPDQSWPEIQERAQNKTSIPFDAFVKNTSKSK